MSKVLVIGYGSIGKLHAEVLRGLGRDVVVVSKHAKQGDGFYQSIEEAISGDLEYVVIASNTSRHFNDLSTLKELGYSGKVLVEKPIFDEPAELTSSDFESVHVGYNLRFHPGVQKIANELQNRTVLTVQHYVGQHLSQWRPGTDHTQSYSAQAKLGGGVLRDLSHELDLMLFLFGSLNRMTGFGGRFSDVTHDSEDAFGMVMSYERCPLAVVQMNYLDHFGGRDLKIVCADTTICLNFKSGQLSVGDQTFDCFADRSFTYAQMHKSILQGSDTPASSFEQGMEILQQIEKLEKL